MELRRLSALSYHRGEWGQELVRKIHQLRRSARRHPDFLVLDKLYPWLFVPLTLWPTHLEGLGQYIAGQMEIGQPLNKQTLLLISLLGEPPGEAVQAVTIQHGKAAQSGNYEALIHAQHKYDYMEMELAHQPEFVKDWADIKQQFEVTQYQDHKQIIRRRMVPERNYRPDWQFKWDTIAEQFVEVFDVFCWRWHLYGMQEDKPLLMKLTVNLTPFGTMIFIPSYWSFDPKRDLKWRAITALHKARGVARQGPKLSQSQVSRREDAERARELWQQATQAGLKGKARNHWIMGQLHWDARTDPSKLRRLLKLVEEG